MASTVADLVRREDLPMDFINWKTYNDDNKEFLRGDLWEFSFINVPKIVYYPGDSLFYGRLNSVNIGMDTSVSGFEKRMRGGWSIYQKTGQPKSGTISLSFVDREDQAITYWFEDWKNKCSDRETTYSFRKADLVGDCKLVLTNSSRVVIRTLKFFNVIISDTAWNENGEMEDGTDRADVQVNLNFEHMTREFNNL
jgi:hypothetical protein